MPVNVHSASETECGCSEGARARKTTSMPGVSSSPCHSLGRQPAKHSPRGPSCAGTTQTTVCRAQARQRRRKALGSWRGAAMLAARTVSCAAAWTFAASQPLLISRGGTSKRASRAACSMRARSLSRRGPARATRIRVGRHRRRHQADRRCPARPHARAAPRERRNRRCRWLRRRARWDRRLARRRRIAARASTHWSTRIGLQPYQNDQSRHDPRQRPITANGRRFASRR